MLRKDSHEIQGSEPERGGCVNVVGRGLSVACISWAQPVDPAYLRTMASTRVVAQLPGNAGLDKSTVPLYEESISVQCSPRDNILRLPTFSPDLVLRASPVLFAWRISSRHVHQCSVAKGSTTSCWYVKLSAVAAGSK